MMLRLQPVLSKHLKNLPESKEVYTLLGYHEGLWLTIVSQLLGSSHERSVEHSLAHAWSIGYKRLAVQYGTVQSLLFRCARFRIQIGCFPSFGVW